MWVLFGFPSLAYASFQSVLAHWAIEIALCFCFCFFSFRRNLCDKSFYICQVRQRLKNKEAARVWQSGTLHRQPCYYISISQIASDLFPSFLNVAGCCRLQIVFCLPPPPLPTAVWINMNVFSATSGADPLPLRAGTIAAVLMGDTSNGDRAARASELSSC